MNAIYQHLLRVPEPAIDDNGHVNNIEYLRWMLDAATAHAEATGGTRVAQNLEATWVVRSHHIEYLRPAFAQDYLTVHTWVASIGRARCLRKYKITRNDMVLAQGETDWVLLNAKTGRPRTIPQEISDCFEIVREDEKP